MSFYYNIYGLTVASTHQLGSWNKQDDNSNIDVRVCFVSTKSIPPPPNGYFNFLESADGLIDFCIVLSSGSARYVIQEDGSRIEILYTETAPFSEVVHYLSSVALGAALRLKGIFCLHASAVTVDDFAILFAGPSGAGKSTLCAAFHKRGFFSISEDLTVLDERNGGYFVWTGYNGIRLLPDSLRHIFGTQALGQATPAGKKYIHSFLSDSTNRVKVKAIYLLAPRDSEVDHPSIVPIDPMSALLLMTDQLYLHQNIGSRWIHRDFPRLGQLLERIPIYMLRRTSQLQDLDATIALLLNPNATN